MTVGKEQERNSRNPMKGAACPRARDHRGHPPKEWKRLCPVKVSEKGRGPERTGKRNIIGEGTLEKGLKGKGRSRGKEN